MAGDIGQIQVGRSPAGIRPVAPVAPSPTPTAPPIVVPTGSGPRRGRTILIALIVVVVLGIGIAVVMSLSGGGTTATPTPTASPTVTATLKPQGKTLVSYFGQPSGIDTSAPEAGLFHGVDASITYSQPSDVAAALGDDEIWLVFGQNELYGPTGQSLSGTTVEARSVVIYELNDVTAAQQAMQTWESGTMSKDLSGFFSFDTAKAATITFLAGTYRQQVVRYRNFAYPDHSIDWSIVIGSNGKSYLVIAGSRQSAFAAIDALTQ